MDSLLDSNALFLILQIITFTALATMMIIHTRAYFKDGRNIHKAVVIFGAFAVMVMAISGDRFSALILILTVIISSIKRQDNGSEIRGHN